MPTDRKEIVETYIAFWRQKDINGILNLLDKQIRYFDMPEQSLIGYQDLADYLSEDIEDESQLHKEIINIELVGEHHAYLTTSLKESPNSPPIIEGTELFEIKNGKIQSIVDNYTYFDHQGRTEETNQATMKKLGLASIDLNHIEQKIRSILENPKHFKDPSFTLQKLASLLSLSRNKISFILNQHMGISFFESLNQQRILWVCEAIKQETQPSSILEVAYEAGFNSSSVFYKSFKTVTGLTPTEYLQQS